jgi:hypothetical protein
MSSPQNSPDNCPSNRNRSARLDDRAEAVEAGWCPDFYAGDLNYEGPVCPDCTARHLVMASHGENGVEAR